MRVQFTVQVIQTETPKVQGRWETARESVRHKTLESETG